MTWRLSASVAGAVLFCAGSLAVAQPPGDLTAMVESPVGGETSAFVEAPDPLSAEASKTRQLTARPHGDVASIPPLEPVGESPTVRGPDHIDVKMLTDRFGEEVTWFISEQDTGALVHYGGPYGFFTTVEVSVEVDPSKCYTFEIYDAGADGICCRNGYGSYEVYYNDVLVGSGGVFGSYDVVYSIGADCEPPIPPWNDDCEDVTPFVLADSVPVVMEGDNRFATVDCPALLGPPEAWYAFTLNKAMDVTIDYCGTSPAFYETYVVLTPECPCSGEWFRAAEWEDVTCGDGNWTVRWKQLPAGTYYWPLYTAHGSVGPYTVTFYGTEPRGACCVGTNCIGDLTEDDCLASDGVWYDYERCEDFVCPEPCLQDTVFVEIFTDEYPGETIWAVLESDTGNVVGTGGPYEQPLRKYRHQVCIDSDKCYSFVIADQWGDGICCEYGEGYYNVYWNDMLVGSGGEFRIEDWVHNIGGGCPLGACCILEDCVATNTYGECMGIGGFWFEDEDCFGSPPFAACPGIPENDLCENATVVTGPYPQVVQSSNINATVDCPDMQDRPWTWWLIDLPYAENELDISFCGNGFAISEAIVSVMDDCLCDDHLPADIVYWYDCPDEIVAPQLHWDNIPGPSQWYFPVSFNYGMEADYTLTIDVIEHVPCVLDCTPNEGEPECYDGYEDTFNSGCGGYGSELIQNPTFAPIECGETVCGTSGIHLHNWLYYREMDWFELTTTTNTIITWEAHAEFPMEMWIENRVLGCSTHMQLANLRQPEDCKWSSLRTDCVPPGTYWVGIAPLWNSAAQCGAKWEGQVRCQPCVLQGACCVAGNCVGNLSEYACTAYYGGAWFQGTKCEWLECPDECPDGEGTITVFVETDWQPQMTWWEVTDHYTGEVIESGGHYPHPGYFVSNVCVDPDGCYDFTIYDDDDEGGIEQPWQPGIAPPHGYEVRWNNAVVRSTMGEGLLYPPQTVEELGEGCSLPTGACCVLGDCVATMPEGMCADRGGQWFLGESCDTFQCPPPCREDLDGDGFIGLADLSILLSNYDQSGMGLEDGDLNGDGKVDLVDLCHLLGVYNQPCPS